MKQLLRWCAGTGAVPLVLLLGSCTERQEPEVPEVPGATPTETLPAGDPTEAVDGTPDPTSTLDVPFECGELLTAGQVVRIVQASLDGETQRIYNDEFLENSGRTGRLTCRYGVPDGGETASPDPEEAQPAVEIAVSSYIDEDTAAGRISDTLGSTSRDIESQSIGGREGYLLTGDDGVTFIVAEGVRTYVITLRRGLVPEAAEVVVILELAGAMLDVPAPTPDS